MRLKGKKILTSLKLAIVEYGNNDQAMILKEKKISIKMEED